jgi:undecaprenyl-diphosphatase
MPIGPQTAGLDVLPALPRGKLRPALSCAHSPSTPDRSHMDIVLALKALIMGLVEGFTEFLPISSTGHLILAGSLLNFTGEKIKVFEIVIQGGAMLAVIWEYRTRIATVLAGLTNDPKARRFALNVVVGFLPAGILGFLFNKKIKAVLFSPVPVAAAFIVGGLIILWVERRAKNNPVAVRVQSVDDMTILDAFKVGCAQTFALIPGTSRSGATIIGGMLLGLSRKAATEFSFFLAIPTLLGATFYSLYKERALLSAADLPLFGIGSLAAFVSAFLCVRWLLRYISSHDFTIFAWYRIVFGLVIIATAVTGTVAWVD